MLDFYRIFQVSVSCSRSFQYRIPQTYPKHWYSPDAELGDTKGNSGAYQYPYLLTSTVSCYRNRSKNKKSCDFILVFLKRLKRVAGSPTAGGGVWCWGTNVTWRRVRVRLVPLPLLRHLIHRQIPSHYFLSVFFLKWFRIRWLIFKENIPQELMDKNWRLNRTVISET